MKFKCGCDINPSDIDIYNLPDCGETWSMLSNGNTKGIFQIESRLGKDWIKKLQPNSIELLSALIAIIRPGVLNATDENGESMAKVFCNRRHGDEYEDIDPSIKPVLDSTFGVLTYQEQMMKIAQVLCGFDLKETDGLRKAAGKKDAKLMSEIRNKFVSGAIKQGIVSEEKANKVYDNIEKSARYLFNLSHSIAYAKLGYICAWLKYHFPLQFYCGWLTHVNDKMDPQEEMRELVQDARMNGVNINPPNLADMKKDTYIKNGEIFMGLNNIKGLVGKSVDSIINKYVPNMNWIQLLQTYTTKQLENLIQAGAIGGNRVRKLAELQTWTSLTKTEQANIDIYIHSSLLDALDGKAATKKEGGICSTQARADLVESLVWSLKKPPRPLVDTPVVIAKFETDMLGVQLTCTKSEGIDQRLVNATIKEILDGKKNGMLAAEIESVKIIKVKNGVNKGKSMAFAKVYDITGAIEAVIFPDQFELYSPYLIKGNTLILKFYSKDLKSIIINDIWQV